MCVYVFHVTELSLTVQEMIKRRMFQHEQVPGLCLGTMFIEGTDVAISTMNIGCFLSSIELASREKIFTVQPVSKQCPSMNKNPLNCFSRISQVVAPDKRASQGTALCVKFSQLHFL